MKMSLKKIKVKLVKEKISKTLMKLYQNPQPKMKNPKPKKKPKRMMNHLQMAMVKKTTMKKVDISGAKRVANGTGTTKRIKRPTKEVTTTYTKGLSMQDHPEPS